MSAVPLVARIRWLTPLFVFTLALAVAVAIGPGIANAGSPIYVDDDSAPGGSGTESDPYATIQNGVDNATAGDTILVEPGQYNESVTVDVSVTLLANGSVTVSGTFSKTGVAVVAPGVEIEGFHVIDHEDGIVVDAQRAVLRSNNVSNNSHAGFLLNANDTLVVNNTAKYNGRNGVGVRVSWNQTVRNNTFVANGQEGIGSGGVRASRFVGNNLSANDRHGIRLRNDAENNVIANNTVIGNDGIGILLDGNGNISIRDNRVRDEHVTLRSTRNVTLRNNTITDTTSIGIGLSLKGANRTVVRRNDVTGFHRGIRVRQGGNNRIANNTLVNNGDGVLIYRGTSRNVVRNNTFRTNSVGVYLTASSTNNTVVDNYAQNNTKGIYVDHSHRNLIRGNTINGSDSRGIFGKYANRTRVVGNYINDSNSTRQGYGVKFVHVNQTTIRGNVINGSTEKGIRVTDGNGTLVQNNYVNDTRGWQHAAGIELVRVGNATVRNNTVNWTFNRHGRGISIEDVNDTVVVNNTVNHVPGKFGIRVERTTRNVTVRNNRIRDAERSGIHVLEVSGLDVVSNTITRSGNHNGIGCIQLIRADSVRVRENHITSCKPSAIATTGGGNHTIAGNVLSPGGGEAGVLIGAKSVSVNVTMVNNTIDGAEDGFYLTAAVDSVIRNNRITDSSWSGLYTKTDSANVTYVNNYVAGGSRYGIHPTNVENFTIRRNTIVNNGDQGVLLDNADSSILVNNTISGNAKGIEFKSGSDNNTVVRNRIFQSADVGVSFSKGHGNLLYDNWLNNSNNVYNGSSNEWNVSRRGATNVLGFGIVGGNYWARPNGTGWSQTCTDADIDGICETGFDHTGDGTADDRLPLAPTRIIATGHVAAEEHDTVVPGERVNTTAVTVSAETLSAHETISFVRVNLTAGNGAYANGTVVRNVSLLNTTTGTVLGTDAERNTTGDPTASDPHFNVTSLGLTVADGETVNVTVRVGVNGSVATVRTLATNVTVGTTAGTPPATRDENQQTIDPRPELNTTTPSDNASGVPVDEPLVLTFDEAVTAGDGNISLWRADGPRSQRLSVTSDAVTVDNRTVTVEHDTFAYSTEYAVTVESGAIVDTSSPRVAFAGITNNSTFDFTTAARPDGSSDTTPPTIETYAVEANNGTLRVRIRTDERVGPAYSALEVVLSRNGSRLGVLDLLDFERHRSGDGYVYSTTYQGADGEYTATLVTAEDSAGNDGASGETRTAVIDTTPPTISNYSLTARNETLVLSFEATEPLAATRIVLSREGGATVAVLTADPLVRKAAGTYKAQYTVDSPGSYVATLETAVDGKGNDGATGQQSTAVVETHTRTDAPPRIESVTVNRSAGNGAVAFVLRFDEPLRRATGTFVVTDASTNVTIARVALTAENVSVEGQTAVVRVPRSVASRETVLIHVPTGAFGDRAGNPTPLIRRRIELSPTTTAASPATPNTGVPTTAPPTRRAPFGSRTVFGVVPLLLALVGGALWWRRR